jgi:hypothetical protein
MLTPNRFRFAALALAVVGSTSSLAASATQISDSARGERWPSYSQDTPGYNARATVQSKQDRYTAPFVPSEPFTAAEKRKFQTPTGKEVDGW